VLAIIIVGAGLLGAGTLLDLAVALAIGMFAGAYSSIFIATPFLAQLKEQQPEMKSLAARVAARRKQSRPTAVEESGAVAAEVVAGSSKPTASVTTRTDSTTRQQPKKQSRSRRKS
jgi:preprotein translocase subunit SecF